MARTRHLPRAPIKEAIIDIRAELPEGVGVADFEPLRQVLAASYPKVTRVESMRSEFSAGSPVPTVTRQSVMGLVFKDHDEKTFAQFRVNGFTFNRLAPYSSWETIFPETMRLWRQYVTVARPASIVRLAARYINRLELPMPITDLGIYLHGPPPIPEGVPRTLRSFLTRVVIVDNETGNAAIVTQALEGVPVNPRQLTVLLDIDAYRDVEFRDPSDPQIETILNQLRELKNNIFFRSITEPAAELFE